jgi:uncharacterized DUF497 family protein
MEFEWDEPKRLRVLAERKIDFRDMLAAFDGRYAYTIDSSRNEEPRYITIAEINGKCFAVIWTLRDECIRIITARRARNDEERYYYQTDDG